MSHFRGNHWAANHWRSQHWHGPSGSGAPSSVPAAIHALPPHSKNRRTLYLAVREAECRAFVEVSSPPVEERVDCAVVEHEQASVQVRFKGVKARWRVDLVVHESADKVRVRLSFGVHGFIEPAAKESAERAAAWYALVGGTQSHNLVLSVAESRETAICTVTPDFRRLCKRFEFAVVEEPWKAALGAMKMVAFKDHNKAQRLAFIKADDEELIELGIL